MATRMVLEEKERGSEALMPGQPRPNFIIAGAAKAGTTSLHEYVKQHPAIFMSENKEPCYFVHGYGVKTWEKYLELFAGSEGKTAIGESSTAYLSCEESAEWIKSALGDLKIVILLRQPARRAYSLYAWMAREGYEDAPTFEKALQRENERLADPNFRSNARQLYADYLYFTTGFYAAQVRRMFDVFGRDQVRVYLFEQFVKDPLAVCRDVFRFLGLDDSFVPNFERHNEGRMPKSIAWQYWLREETRRRRALGSRKFRGRIAHALMEFNIRHGVEPKADRALLAQLTERYRDDIAATQELTGLDLSGWLKS